MDVSLALFIIITTYLTVVIARWALKRHKRLSLFKRYGISGPETSFITGNMNQLKSGATPNDIITSWLKEYGDVFGYFLGDIPYLVIKDLDMIKQVFIKDFHVFNNRQDMFLDIKPFNNSVIYLKDKRWKEVRSFLAPTFSSGKIKLMTDIVNKKVDITLDVVEKHAQKNEMFDIYELVQGLTLDVIADCALAMKTDCQKNPKDIFLISVRDFFRYIENWAMDYAIMFPFVATIITFILKYMTSGRMTSLIVYSVNRAIAVKRENPDVKSMDYLKLMLDHSDAKVPSGLTDEEIVANAYVFMLAGYETTATALAFTIYLLVKHPEIQEKLYQEIEKIEDSSYSSVQSLQYLDQVFSESLRYYPPVTGFVSRQCQQDHQVGSITIPEGAVVLAPVWDIHHDPELWPDPWNFDPDRFSLDNKASLNTHTRSFKLLWNFDPDRFSLDNKASLNSMAYMPFGIGRRNCIGARFAQLEVKLAIFRLLKKFKLEACEKTGDNLLLKCPTFIINPANGVYLRTVPRTATS
ncbi:unnamed protein product [Larinioides sclopetarius]|uniref:Cytochrome P450 n=1 Tax=Larinioides sclopetarius TaxID=280406 RepID=A0AAV2AUA0_9ARAC